MLCGRGLTKSFGGHRVLGGVDIALASGEIVALLGESGAGKSTLLRVLAMLEGFDAGTVTLEGADCRFAAAAGTGARPAPWPTVSVVFQDLFLWPHLTNRENVMLPLQCIGVENADERLADVTASLDLGQFIARYPNEVSRGQRQAIALARAIALKPEYLLLDEVTASLDIGRSAKLAGVLRKMACGGTGVLVITHQLPFARSWADRIVFLHNGRIAEEGPPSVLDGPASPSLREFIATLTRVA